MSLSSPITRRTLLTSSLAAPAMLAGQQSQRPPNLLFFFPDQWRYDWTNFTPGLDVRLPVLESLAARGVRFTRAIVASPVCAPSRACLASGREYDQCGVPSNGTDYPLAQTTYYRRLRDQGYAVLGCGKLDLHKATEDWGVDGRRLVKDWGFTDAVDNAGKYDAIRSTSRNGRPMDPFMEHLRQRGLLGAHIDDFSRRTGKQGFTNCDPCPLPDPDYGDIWSTTKGLELLRAVPQGQPWHIVFNFPGPHNPMDITKSMHASVQGREYPQPIRSREYSAATHTAIRQNYTAMCETIDQQMGRVLAEVEARGELANTIVAFTSDHGEMLGDHERWTKSVPHQASIGVPMVIAGPGVKPRVTDALVSHMDLAATFLDYASAPVLPDMASRSLRPLAEGRADAHRDVALSGLNKWRVAWDGRYKLVRNFTYREVEVENVDPSTAEVLFDLQHDPHETQNIAPANPHIVSRLRERIGGT
ncbi:MAG: sulfatase-like hydrolase/transferase [Bryobacterales bacterium]|nr:sulfatase-like hydrolase/transferase [Bryobacterales bacterium]